ncbi:phage tail protein [Salinivibrio socompensis]|uniref:phage tail protein n=1 Tax=Salinivibrio socompensis TaxID=1510206 RepID=UPI00046F2532|nr:phage tail protein [Salinivibrio socompensis]
MQIWHWSPRPGAQRKRNPNVVTAKFGDGYSQRAPNGINNSLAEYDVTFRATTEETQRMDCFLVEHKGTHAFIYQPHGDFTDKIVICQSWSVTDRARWSELKATFTEVQA